MLRGKILISDYFSVMRAFDMAKNRGHFLPVSVSFPPAACRVAMTKARLLERPSQATG
jgi:hypothetical protein